MPFLACLHWKTCWFVARQGTTKTVFSQKTKTGIIVNMSVFKRYGNGWSWVDLFFDTLVKQTFSSP